jgi:archaellum component FlaC
MMAPEYEKLYDLYQKGDKHHVVIARLEAGANEDIAKRYNIFHFPTVVMFAPKNQEIFSVFKGKRIVAEFNEWIEHNSVHQVEEKTEEDEDYFLVGDEDFIENFNKTEFHQEIEGVKKEIQELHEKITKLEDEIKSLKTLPTSTVITSNSNINNTTTQTVKEDVKFIVLHNLRMPTVFELLVGLGGMLTLLAVIMTVRKLMAQKKSNHEKTNHHAKV